MTDELNNGVSEIQDENKLIKERLDKISQLRDKGVNPYPYRYSVDTSSEKLHQRYDGLRKEDVTSDYFSVAGRVMLMRKMGKVTFLTLQDAKGKIQIMLRSNILNKAYDLINYVDLGDIIGVYGNVMKTKTAELTISATKFEILTKSIRPLPEKYHGLKDTELRYRMRYLDLIMNPEVKDVFFKRTQVFNIFRRLLDQKDFLEVDTPIMQVQYGGANAKPFKTHLNALDMPLYLRISNELFLKRLLVGGFDRVYEFSKDFRNEGIDRTHNPEFTQIEIYQAYADYNDMMLLTQQLVSQAVLEVTGKYKALYGEQEIDFTPPFKVMTMKDAVKQHTEIDIDALSKDDYDDLIQEHDLEVSVVREGNIVYALFEKYVEEKLINPTFITQHPIGTTPLCKPEHDNDEYVERFELFVAGFELANAYSELNDPVLQRKLLECQAQKLQSGDEESHPMDEDFVKAIEFGMPPAGGVGIGVDRLVMLVTDSHSIRDVLLFPFMKPE